MGATDIMVIQGSILILGLLMFFFIQYIPKRALSRIKSKNRTAIESNRHFIQGTHFLTRAKSTNQNKTHSQSLAKQALNEAESALALSPKDPGPLTLKSLALDYLGRKLPALRAIDLALNSNGVGSIQGSERGDALFKRAELKLAVNRRRRVDSAIEDLKEAVKLCAESHLGKLFCLLGQCYESKGLNDEATWAFEKASEAQPDSSLAHEGLKRLGPLSKCGAYCCSSF